MRDYATRSRVQANPLLRKIPVMIYLDLGQIERLALLCEEYNVTRTEFIRNLLDHELAREEKTLQALADRRRARRPRPGDISPLAGSEPGNE